jgi:hypothetical protein
MGWAKWAKALSPSILRRSLAEAHTPFFAKNFYIISRPFKFRKF